MKKLGLLLALVVLAGLASAQTTIFSDDMTNFPTGWTLSPTTGWTKTSTKYYSASYSARCDDISNYGNSQNNYMTRSVSLSGYSSASLSFYIWQYTESGYDYVYLQYYSGSTWTTAWSRAGSYQSWAKQTVSIPVTATQVRFWFKSDASVVYTGAFIDDVVLTAKSGGTTPNYTKSTATYSWVTTSTSLGLSGDDAYKAVTLPFTFNFYGTNYTSVNVCTNGFLNFGTSSTAYSPATIPSTAAPNALMAALWRDLNADASTSITYSSSTSQFVVTYGNIKNYSNTSRQTFQVILTPDGKIKYQWQTVTNDVTTSIGVENQGGTLGVSHASPTSGSAILFTPPTAWAHVALLAGEAGQEEGPVSSELLPQNFPNPFVGRTTFCFNLQEGREASLKVYNVSGQLVRTLVSGHCKAGHHKLEWDARDDYGRKVANGTYLYRLEAGDLLATRKLVILR
jgi:hypothetical protein